MCNNPSIKTERSRERKREREKERDREKKTEDVRHIFERQAKKSQAEKTKSALVVSCTIDNIMKNNDKKQRNTRARKNPNESKTCISELEK